MAALSFVTPDSPPSLVSSTNYFFYAAGFAHTAVSERAEGGGSGACMLHREGSRARVCSHSQRREAAYMHFSLHAHGRDQHFGHGGTCVQETEGKQKQSSD